MIEQLGPNMARSLMGSAYDPDCKYELETGEDCFYIIITNPADGTSSSMRLEAEEPDPERLTPIWHDDLQDRLPQKDVFNSILFWLFMIAGVASILLTYFYRLGG